MIAWYPSVYEALSMIANQVKPRKHTFLGESFVCNFYRSAGYEARPGVSILYIAFILVSRTMME